MKVSMSYLYWACSKEVAPLKWSAINKISSMIHNFCYIMHYYCFLQEVLHIWYQSTFLGTSGNFFFFSKKEGKIGRWLSHPFLKLFVQIQEKQVAYLNSYFQSTPFQKTNHIIWSSKSGDITDLKSAIFQNFDDDRRNCKVKIF